MVREKGVSPQSPKVIAQMRSSLPPMPFSSVPMIIAANGNSTCANLSEKGSFHFLSYFSIEGNDLTHGGLWRLYLLRAPANGVAHDCAGGAWRHGFATAPRQDIQQFLRGDGPRFSAVELNRGQCGDC